MLCIFFPEGSCASLCVRECERVCMCHSSEIDLLSLYFKLASHISPFATSEGRLFVDIKRFSVSFVIQIIIPISVGFDVYIAVLCCALARVCVWTRYLLGKWYPCMNIISGVSPACSACTLKIQLSVNTGFVESY